MTLEQPLATRPPAGLAEAAEAHLDDVYGYLLYLTRDRETAEDLASSTFEKALRMWSRFDPQRGSARSWLLGIARTTALDWFRSESRRRRREEAAALSERVEESFAEGQAQGPDDETVRDFAEGQEQRHHEHHGDFAEGQEEHDHADDDPEGDFAEGQRQSPDR